MKKLPAVTVIIATSCELQRTSAMHRAVASVFSQTGVDVHVVAIVNGDRADPTLLGWLQGDARIRVERLEEGNYPAAARVGRSLVEAEFFAYLDDDDEFLPGALQTRVDAFFEDPLLDFIATNGFLHDSGEDRVAYDPSPEINEDPIAELLRASWMQPCGNMFRSSTVELEFFDGATKFYEWTLLAFRLSRVRRFRYLDVPTYRKHDTPGSLFKSAAVVEAGVVVVDKLLAMDPIEKHRRALMVIRRRALHSASDASRVKGDPFRAWLFHLRSLGHPGGWRHIPYTRKLVGSLFHIGRRASRT